MGRSCDFGEGAKRLTAKSRGCDLAMRRINRNVTLAK
jgi:hypothetical protein